MKVTIWVSNQIVCHFEPCVRNLFIYEFRDPSSLRSVGMTFTEKFWLNCYIVA